MSYSVTNAGKYTHIWQKYRPVLLKMMIDSASEPQSYDLSSHEFIDANNKKTTGYSFALKVYQNRNVSDKKTNVAGSDLLTILQASQKANELTQTATYSFEMDRYFKLQVSSVPMEAEETSEGEETSEEEKASEA